MFFSICNLLDHGARQIEKPWELENTSPYDMKKSAYREWSKQPTTNHHWISLCEGTSANVRITAGENDVLMVHGVIADYDAKPAADLLKHVKENNPADTLPNWICKTQSGYCRLIWLFEQPFRVCGTEDRKSVV
jgi:hypothetical protein